jgi:hypothetical protein
MRKEKTPLEWSKTKKQPLNIFTMLGISGTGKGTRLSQLIHYLSSTTSSDNIICEIEGKPTMIGVYFKEYNLVVFGKWVKSNKKGNMLSFSSYDWLQSLKTSEGEGFFDLVKYLVSQNKVQNIAFEGYPCMVTHKVLHELFKEEEPSVNSCYFFYPGGKEGFEHLQKRIVGRSGSRIKGTCWGGNIDILRKAKAHESYINSDPNIKDTALRFTHDAPITVFGEMLLKVISKQELVEDFKKFSTNNNTLRDLQDLANSINKITPYYEKQLKDIDEGVNF